MGKKILAMALLILIALLALTGCSAENKEEKMIKEMVTSYLTDYINSNPMARKHLSEYVLHSDEDLAKIEIREIEKPIAKHLEFKILGITKTEKGYSVNTELKNYDFADIFERVIIPNIEKQATEDEIILLMNAEVEKGNLEKKTVVVDIPLSLYGSNYKIELAEDIADAMVGGINTAYANHSWKQWEKLIEEAGNPMTGSDQLPENYWSMTEEEYEEYMRNKWGDRYNETH